MSQFLFSFTLLIHLLVVNVLIGGLPVLIFTNWVANRTDQQACRHLIRFITDILPWCLLVGIILGIGSLALSFLTNGSTVSGAGTAMGHTWTMVLLVLILLLAGLLVLRTSSRRQNERVSLNFALVGGIFSGLLIVAFLFVSLTVLILVPEYWATIQSQGLGKLLSLPTVMPRFFHVVVASIAAIGCLVMLYGVNLHTRGLAGKSLEPSLSIEQGVYLTRYGGFWTMAGTVPQIVVGPWLLWSLPDHVRIPLVNGGTYGSIIFFISLSAALFAIVMLNASVVAPQYRWLALAGVASLLVTFGTMIIVREEVRHYWMRGKESLVTTFGQHDPTMGLAILLFILGLGLAITWFFLGKRTPSES